MRPRDTGMEMQQQAGRGHSVQWGIGTSVAPLVYSLGGVQPTRHVAKGSVASDSSEAG